MNKYLILLLGILVLSSCSTKKDILYFQDAEKLQGMQNKLEYEPIIQPNDALQINVTSFDEEVVAPFNIQSAGQQSGGGAQSASLMGYLVDPEGVIKFPVLGDVAVGGKKRSEVENLLQSQIRDYVTDAVVSVRILNFSVTVLGETGASRVQVSDGRITIPELIATTGDITFTGKRDNIMVIRESNGIKSVGRVDLTSTDIFSNPYYYLKQNDIVYVEPTYKKVKSAGFFTSYQGIISVGTTIISLYLLINGLK